MKHRTSKAEKGITLVALIITIIVLLILAGVVIGQVTNNRGILNRAKDSTTIYRNSENEEAKSVDGGGTSTSGGSGISGTGTTIAKDSYPAITVTGLIYADLDGDTSTAEGLVVATSDGSAVTSSTTMPDGYTMSDYAGESKTSSGKIITATTKGGSNFYVLALADYDSSTHTWWYNAYSGSKMTDYSTFTSKAIGQGKTNTSKMIDRVKNPSNYSVSYGDPKTNDMWYIIKDETDWFTPSKDEWKAILNNLTNNFSLTTSNYSNYGLRPWYWSSSQHDSSGAWGVDFDIGYMYDYGGVFSGRYVRLCATF